MDEFADEAVVVDGPRGRLTDAPEKANLSREATDALQKPLDRPVDRGPGGSPGAPVAFAQRQKLLPGLSEDGLRVGRRQAVGALQKDAGRYAVGRVVQGNRQRHVQLCKHIISTFCIQVLATFN